jgi:hypothetical protein
MILSTLVLHSIAHLQTVEEKTHAHTYTTHHPPTHTHMGGRKNKEGRTQTPAASK